MIVYSGTNAPCSPYKGATGRNTGRVVIYDAPAIHGDAGVAIEYHKQ